jgi:hypothetical protein
MSQYDAGPGDWSDRDWESPDYEQEPQAKPRRLALPSWALLAIVVAAVILLCVGLVFIVRAIRNGGDEGVAEAPTPTVAATTRALPTSTMTLPAPTATSLPPTATIALPTEVPPTEEPLDTGGIVAGGRVEVYNSNPDGLNIRAEASTQSESLQRVTDTTRMQVLDGPVQGEGYVWWKVKTKKGTEGWAVGQYLKPYP